MRKHTVFRGLAAISEVAMALCMSLTTLTLGNTTWINFNLNIANTETIGGNDDEFTVYYANDYGYDSTALIQVYHDAADVMTQIASEGMTLLKNDSSDVITVDLTDIDSSATATATDAQPDVTCQMSADFEWDPEYVSNPSYTIEDGEAVTSSEMNTISGDFCYPGFICKAFNFPRVCESFDPEEGGMMPGMQSSDTDEEDEDDSVYFEATPIDPVDGAEYSYDIIATSPSGSITATPKLSPGGATAKRIFGELDINSDGTFKMTIEYQYLKTDPMNSAVYYVPATECDGTYTTNADGTLNLSYDHENAFELDYDIVTEKTGRALKWAQENPELAAQEEEEANQMPGGGPGGMPAGPGDDAAAGDNSDAAGTEAPAEAETAPAPEG